MTPRARLRALWLATAITALSAASASAEAPSTSQARAYGLDWISAAPDARFGDPTKRPVICLLDTGVAITPDTPPDSPTGPIVARLSAVDNDPLGGDAAATVHGTRMAAAIAAPANGWGVVGIWPGAQIVAIKIGSGDSVGIDADQAGISMCSQWARGHNRVVAVVNLSQGVAGSVPPQAQLNLREGLAYAAQLGASVVASAGNVPGRGTEWPASSPEVVAVGAGTADGTGWCPFASHDQLTTLVGPGCDVEAADDVGGAASWAGAGSSYATAVVSAVIGAMRSLRPESDRPTVESWLMGSRRALDGVRVLDGFQVAVAAGVSDLVRPLAPIPVASVTAPPPLKRARVRALTRSRLRVESSNSIRGFELQTAVRVSGAWRRASGRRAATVKGVRRTPARVWVRWRSSNLASAASSPWTPLGRPSSQPSKRSWVVTTRRGPEPTA